MAKTYKNQFQKFQKQLKATNRFFILCSTSSNIKISPYTTPIRFSGNRIIAGSVVGSQIEALIVADYIENLVDFLLLDVEKKKNPIQNIPDEEIFLNLI